MPRKFLGEKILYDIDFVRPSSLTLTSEELRQLPTTPFVLNARDGEEILGGEKLPQKLSRKFGGTIRLRQRLGSVPELFLHDFNNRPKRGGKKLRSRGKLAAPQLPPLPTLVEDDGPLMKVGNPIDNIFVSNPITLPVQVSRNSPNAFYHHKASSKSTNEILFDEILEAYTAEAVHKSSKVLQDEICRVVENITRQTKCNSKSNTLLKPTIVNSQNQDEFFELHASPILEPSSPIMLENLSSPEYTGTSASDRWGSSDEFSDFGSISTSLVDEANEEGYYTATDSIGSTFDNPAKKIPDACPSFVQASGKNPLKIVSLKAGSVTPIILYVSDEEDEDEELMKRQASIEDLRQLSRSSFGSLEVLRRQIDCIDIGPSSCASSLYSS